MTADRAASGIRAPLDVATAPPTRMAWVDRLRVVLTFLVVAHHCAITYSTIPLWYWAETGDDSSASLLTVFVVVNQLWFMGAFFLLSGVFAPGSLDRKGPARFAADRLIRLGIPLVLFVLLLRPLALLPGAIAGDAEARGVDVLTYVLVGGDPGPAWFLEVLLVFSLGAALIRRVIGKRESRVAVAKASPLWGLLAFAAVLVAATVLWQRVVPDGSYWPVVGLPTPAYLMQYLAMFLVGIVAARRGWLQSVPRWWIWPAAALMAGGAVCSALGPAATPIANPLFATGAIVTAVIVFRRFADGPLSRGWSFLAENAFAVYVLHAPVVVAVSALLVPLALPAWGKATLLFAIAAPVTWLLAAALRAIPGVRRVF
ncbi:acyltransferase [Microbacterium sp. 179-I 3D2 NHS]|uniref:acyltransferase family protein n=1 Tax=Microbacterium sp. 179-I 3D2 NHS TaxID=3235178 RepID=UPI0039A063AC